MINPFKITGPYKLKTNPIFESTSKKSSTVQKIKSKRLKSKSSRNKVSQSKMTKSTSPCRTEVSDCNIYHQQSVRMHVTWLNIKDQFWELTKTGESYKIIECDNPHKNGLNLIAIINKNLETEKENAQLKSIISNFDSILEMVKMRDETFFLNEAHTQKFARLLTKYNKVLETVNKGLVLESIDEGISLQEVQNYGDFSMS